MPVSMPATITEPSAPWPKASQAKPATPISAPTARVCRAPIRRTSRPPTGAAASAISALGSRYSTEARSTEAVKP